MPSKTLILHLPVGPGPPMAASPIAVNPSAFTSTYPSLNNNCAPPSPFCPRSDTPLLTPTATTRVLTSTNAGATPEGGMALDHSIDQVSTPGGSASSTVSRRSSTLRKKRRIKALSVGHISPTSPICLQSAIEADIRSGMSNPLNLSCDYGNSDSSLEAAGRGCSSVTGLHPLPPTSAAGSTLQKPSYMTKVANGLGLTRSGISEQKKDREEHSGLSSLGAFGLAGILFGTRHPGQAGQAGNEPQGVRTRSSSKGGARSRSKSSAGRKSRPGTSAGLISTVDVDKPLPSRPVSRELEGEYKGAFASRFGKPGYNFHFVDHETLTPSTRSNSRTRPRSISSAAVLSGNYSTSSVNAVRLEPILPVHVLDRLVSRLDEISPDTASSVVQRYLSHTRTDSSKTILQGGHSGSMQTLAMDEAINAENIASRVYQRSCVDEGGAGTGSRDLTTSLTGPNSTAQRYPCRPSRSNSSCRGIRSSSPATSEISRPSTSSSMMSTMLRREDSRRRLRQIEIDSDNEDAPRGRGRTVTLERIDGYPPGDLRRQHSEKERDEEEKTVEPLKEQMEPNSGKTVFSMTRKPVPAPVSRARGPSRSTSRSRSRPRTSRAPSPENAHVMSTIQESSPALADASSIRSLARSSSLRPRLISIEKTNASRTPSPLRVIRRMQSSDSTKLFSRARSASADAYRVSNAGPEIPRVQAPTAQQQASLASRDATASSSSLRAKFRVDAERITHSSLQPHVSMLPELPRSIPAASSIAGMPKRKPVPTECVAVSLTSPPHLEAEPKSAHMIVSALPPPLTMWSTPKSSGTVCSEDEDDLLSTPGTARTFNFVTPLLPSPPKRQLGIPIRYSQVIPGDENSPQKTVAVPVSSSPSDTSYTGSLPQTGTITTATASTNIRMNDNLDDTKVAVSIVQATTTQGNLQPQFPGSSISEPCSPKDTRQRALEPALPVHKDVDQSTQHRGAPTTSECNPTLEPVCKGVITERMHWAEERQYLQRSVDMLQTENSNLRELVSQLTERLERQDAELRDMPKRTKQQRLPLPEALVASRSSNSTSASAGPQATDSGKGSQHSSSRDVSVNHRTSPPPLLAEPDTARPGLFGTNPHIKSKYTSAYYRPGSISTSSSPALPRPVAPKENQELLLPPNPDRSNDGTLRVRGVSPSRIPRMGAGLHNNFSVGNSTAPSDSTIPKDLANQSTVESVPEQSQTQRKGPRALWKRTAAAATRKAKTSTGTRP